MTENETHLQRTAACSLLKMLSPYYKCRTVKLSWKMAPKKRTSKKTKLSNAQHPTGNWQGSPLMLPANPSMVRICAKFNIKYLKLIFAAYPLSLVSLCMVPSYSPWLTRIPILMSMFYHFSPCSKKWSLSSSFHSVCDRFNHWARILMDDNCSIWSRFPRYTTVLKGDFNIFTQRNSNVEIPDNPAWCAWLGREKCV